MDTHRLLSEFVGFSVDFAGSLTLLGIAALVIVTALVKAVRFSRALKHRVAMALKEPPNPNAEFDL